MQNRFKIVFIIGLVLGTLVSTYSMEHQERAILNEIINLIQAGASQRLKEFLGKNLEIDLNIPDQKGLQPLHYAIIAGNLLIVDLLLDKGANVNALVSDGTGSSALHLAARAGKKKIVQCLVERGADLEWSDNAGNLPKDYAKKLVVSALLTLPSTLATQNPKSSLSSDQLGQAARWLNTPATFEPFVPASFTAVNAGSEHASFCPPPHPFSRARYPDYSPSNKYEKEKEKGGEEEQESFAKDTYVTQEMLDKALFGAIHKKELDKVILLINLGASVNAQATYNQQSGDSDEHVLPIHIAAGRGYQEIVKCLLDHGVEINASGGSNGYQAIHQAAAHGHLALVKWLVSEGVDINAQDCKQNQASHYAADGGHLSVIKWLVKQGADINAKNNKGGSPICRAGIDSKHMDLALWMLQHGAKDQEVLDVTLFRAVVEGTLDKIIKLINLGANINLEAERAANGGFFLSKTDKSLPLIHFAAMRGDQEITKCLVDHGANINAREGAKGSQPIHQAALDGHLVLVKWLVKNGVDINAKNNDDVTPVRCAAYKNHMDVVVWLLNHGAKDKDFEAQLASNNKDAVRIRRSITTEEMPEELITATEAGNLGMVKALVEIGADLKSEIRNRYDFLWPLHVAAKKGHKGIVKYLIQQGADVSTPVRAGQHCGYTPLHYAAQYGHQAVAEYLIKRGADVRAISQIDVVPRLRNVVGSSGIQPIHTAAWGSNQKIAELLIKYGANIKAQDDRGDQPIHYVLTLMNARNSGEQHDALVKKDQALVKWFLMNGASIDARSYYGEQPIHYAARGGDLAFFKWLVDHGADIRAQRIDSTSVPTQMFFQPIHCAAYEGHLEIIQWLVSKGIDIDVRDGDGETALGLALSSGHQNLAEWLVANGADVNAQCAKGWTPLHEAVTCRNSDLAIKLVELLLINSADVNVRIKQGTQKGKRPIDLARKQKNKAVVNLLKNANKEKVKSKDKERCLLS